MPWQNAEKSASSRCPLVPYPYTVDFKCVHHVKYHRDPVLGVRVASGCFLLVGTWGHPSHCAMMARQASGVLLEAPAQCCRWVFRMDVSWDVWSRDSRHSKSSLHAMACIQSTHMAFPVVHNVEEPRPHASPVININFSIQVLVQCHCTSLSFSAVDTAASSIQLVIPLLPTCIMLPGNFFHRNGKVYSKREQKKPNFCRRRHTSYTIQLCQAQTPFLCPTHSR